MIKLNHFPLIFSCFANGLIPIAAEAARHALLIGISDYQSQETGLSDLPGTLNDLALMRQVLSERLGFPWIRGCPSSQTFCQFEGNSLTVLVNQQATHTRIHQAFDELAQRVQPGDFVYIHYSGHGSLAPDLNGDETGHYCTPALVDGQSKSSLICWDETWVSYGARTRTAAGLDQWDILDDEVNRWMNQVTRRASQAVLVVDACHSATSMRGHDMPAVRAAPPVMESHPEGTKPYQPSSLDLGLQVTAAQDNESAIEITHDQKPYGEFSWQWARSLEQAGTNESWRQIFRRASTLIDIDQHGTQHPQIAGSTMSEAVLGGLPQRDTGIVVTEVKEGTATLAVSLLQGATPGSRYQAQLGQPPALVELTEVRLDVSRGKVLSGRLNKGDFVNEIEHNFPGNPLKVYLAAESAADEILLARLQQLFQKESPRGRLSGYVLTTSQGQADLTLQILRPKIAADGKSLIYRMTSQSREVFPDRDPEGVPEVWVVNTPNQRLLSERMRISLRHMEAGLDQLAENLKHYRKLRAIETLSQTHRESEKIRVEGIVFEECQNPSSCAGSRPAFLENHRPSFIYPVGTPFALDDIEHHPLRAQQLLSFQITSTSHLPYYVYLLNVDDNGRIQSFYPIVNGSSDTAMMEAKATVSLPDRNYYLRLETGNERLWVVVTGNPIDIQPLLQTGYVATQRGKESKPSNPLEMLLVGEISGARGSGEPTQVTTGAWSSQVFHYQVEPAQGLIQSK